MPDDDDLQEWHDHLFDLLAQQFTTRHETGVKLVEIRERIANIRIVAAKLRCINGCDCDSKRIFRKPS